MCLETKENYSPQCLDLFCSMKVLSGHQGWLVLSSVVLLLFTSSQKHQSWRCSVMSRWQQSERACPPSSLFPSFPCWLRSSWSSWSAACRRSLSRCWRSWCVTAISPRATSWLSGSGRVCRSSPMRSGCFSCALSAAGPGCLPTLLTSHRSSKSSRWIGWGHF